ncbi:MAG: 3-phosphoshikimate 1-carboxyvinyltransferase [Planctomycetota bacterium]
MSGGLGLDALAEPIAALADPLAVPVVGSAGSVDSVVRMPGSKSETNRAVVLASLARGRSVLRHALTEADDAVRALDAVQALGARVEIDGTTVSIDGVGGRWPVGPGGVTIDLNNAGTATRFLTAAAMLADGPVTVTGNARMRARPIGQLGAALESLGGTLAYLGDAGCPPVRVTPPAGGLPHGREVVVGTPDSSQFVSALLMLGPWVRGGVTVRIEGEVTSGPYLTMTLDLLDRVGAEVQSSSDLRVLRCGPGAMRVGSAGLDGFELEVEPDASGATTFWTAAALLPGSRVLVEGLGSGSVQGDVGYVRLLERMRAEVTELPDGGGIEVRGPVSLSPLLADLSAMPDTAMNLAVACSFATGPSVLRGLRTLRVKETDRIAALERELKKLGVGVSVQGDDAMTITPPTGGVDCSEGVPRLEFDTYDDHRMAMSLSLVGLRRPNTYVRDPGCVAKTFPGYWRSLAWMLGWSG